MSRQIVFMVRKESCRIRFKKRGLEIDWPCAQASSDHLMGYSKQARKLEEKLALTLVQP